MTAMRTVHLAALVAVAVLAPACGSGGGGGSAPPPGAATAVSVPPDDGTLGSNETVVVRFSESMNPASLVLGGTMAADGPAPCGPRARA